MKFFSRVFGWTFERYSQFIDNPYFCIITGEVGSHGMNCGIQRRTTDRPGLEMGTNAATLSMDVEEL